MASATSRSAIQDFFESALGERLQHYVFGNRRVERAIAFALGNLPPWAASVVDVGCGIGYSTHRLKRSRPELAVDGIDLSSAAIAAAQKLFGDEGLSFRACDILDLVSARKYDTAILLDIYEHVPRTSWPRLHVALGGILAEKAAVLMTTPTPALQAYLKQHHPSRLQVVDEVVTEHDIADFASGIGGELMDLRRITVWQPHDYFQVVLQRGGGVDSVAEDRPEPLVRRVAEAIRCRRRDRRVRLRLGLRITPDGRVEPLDG